MVPVLYFKTKNANTNNKILKYVYLNKLEENNFSCIEKPRKKKKKRYGRGEIREEKEAQTKNKGKKTLLGKE